MCNKNIDHDDNDVDVDDDKMIKIIIIYLLITPKGAFSKHARSEGKRKRFTPKVYTLYKKRAEGKGPKYCQF